MNEINVIEPYRYLEMWVFDDPKVGLSAEPFVGGADTMIDRVTAELPGADRGFVMIFSRNAFPGHQFRLEWRREEGTGNVYYSRELDAEGWLCRSPSLLRSAAARNLRSGKGQGRQNLNPTRLVSDPGHRVRDDREDSPHSVHFVL